MAGALAMRSGNPALKASTFTLEILRLLTKLQSRER